MTEYINMAGKTGRVGRSRGSQAKMVETTLQFDEEIFHEHAVRYLIILVEDGDLVVCIHICIRNSCRYSIANFLSASPFVAMMSLATAAITTHMLKIWPKIPLHPARSSLL